MLLFWAKTGKTSAYFLRFDKKKKKSRSGFDLVTSRGTKVAYRAKTHIFFAPERYTAGILFTDSLYSA